MVSRPYTPALNPSGDVTQWKLPETINKILRGKINNVADVTLRAGQTTTVIKNPLIGPTSHINLTPLTASASVALASAYISARIDGSATITHPLAVAVDQNFTYQVVA